MRLVSFSPRSSMSNCSRENASGVELGMSTKHFITLFHCYLRVDSCYYSWPHFFVLGGRIIEYNEN